jgi:cobalt-zinc-cadmium efflux system membrane fusion protein
MELEVRPRGARALSPETQVRLVAYVAIAFLALFGSWLGISWLLPARADSAPPQAPADGTFQPTQAQFASLMIRPIARRDFPAVTTTEGNIATDDDLTTPVYSPFSGRVTKLEAKLGDRVAKGAPLMTVEAQEYVQAQNDLVTAVSNLNSTRAQLALARTNEKRQHELFDARGAALKDWQQSQSDLATAEGNHRTAEIALAAVRNRLRIFGMSDRAIAALARASIGIQTSPEAAVFAPIGGIVILRQVGLGQFIQSGASNPVFSIGDLSTVWLVANVREADAPLMQLGQPVDVRVAAFPRRVFHAKLSYVAPGVDPATRRLQVRADIPNPQGLLKPQMFANFSIVTGVDRSAPAVPESSIVYEGDTARIWIVRRDNRIALREIRTGRIDDGMVEVLHGALTGERVVTSGAIFIDRAATSD